MSDDRAFEALLHEALGRRGAPAPFPVDVADGVMIRVAAIGPPRRREMDLRQFGRWAVAASIAGLALLTAAAWQAPSLAGLVAGLGHALTGTTAAALNLLAHAGSLAGTLGRVATTLLGSARALVEPFEPLQLLARATLAATAAVMLAITSFVVGRDLRTRVAGKEQA